MKRKKRSVKASRAASLKGWRVRQRMKEARQTHLGMSGKTYAVVNWTPPWDWPPPDDDDRTPTIDLIPKVTWP